MSPFMKVDRGDAPRKRETTTVEERRILQEVRQRDEDRCVFCGRKVNFRDRFGKPTAGTYWILRWNAPAEELSADGVAVCCQGCLTVVRGLFVRKPLARKRQDAVDSDLPHAPVEEVLDDLGSERSLREGRVEVAGRRDPHNLGAPLSVETVVREPQAAPLVELVLERGQDRAQVVAPVVIDIEVKLVGASADEQRAFHDQDSPSVGASDDATVGTSEPTEGDLAAKAATFKHGDRVEDVTRPGRIYRVAEEQPEAVAEGFVPYVVFVDPTPGWRNRVGERGMIRADLIKHTS
ncbi:hypothetical protein [Zhihengliuella sp.]|uniref:hypothetical protein n=1 Tax=Zhihengliuella sp. TaxID=1954483 RepID=UPI002811E148|nr:hypothetical protein [Zhihengliuella sp.]